jgi:predicted GIY-YIG superfamily endonuclease
LADKIAESEGCRAEVKRKRASTMNFFYVYILQSRVNSPHFYTGLTENLLARLKKHNAGEVAATSTFRP